MTIESFPLNSDSCEFNAWDYFPFNGFILTFSETSLRELRKQMTKSKRAILYNEFTK